MQKKNKFLLLVTLFTFGNQLCSETQFKQNLEHAENKFYDALADYFAEGIRSGDIVIPGWDDADYNGKADLVRELIDRYCDELFLSRISYKTLQALGINRRNNRIAESG